MKKPVKMSAVAGFFLFGVAALFSIALLLVLGDFAGTNPAQATALYRMGKMFVSVYGFCAVLIPAFLVIAAIQCFSDTWTLRRGVLLAGFFLPFFTLDALEHAIRMLTASDSGAVLGIKLSATLLTGALIIAAEVLVLLLISDFLESALMKQKHASGADGYEDDYDGIDVIDSESEVTEEALIDDEELSAEEADSSVLPTVVDNTTPPSETLADGSANPFVNFFGSPLPEPTEPTIEQAVLAEQAGEPINASAITSALIAPAEPVAPSEPTADDEPAEPQAPAAELEPEEAEPTAELELYQPVPVSQPHVHEAPHYNESITPLIPLEDDEPSEVLELNSFDPDRDSFDGYTPHEEEIGEMEPVDDEIAAFEQQNADDFDDDFYDIDLNADDDEDDLDAEIDDYEQRLAREDAEREEQEESAAIAPEEQKSTSLDSIFAEMDDDAAREPQGITKQDDASAAAPIGAATAAVAASTVAASAAPAVAQTARAAQAGAQAQVPADSFDEPVFDEDIAEETEIDFADDGIFDDEMHDEADYSTSAADTADNASDFAEPAVESEIAFADADVFEEPVLDEARGDSDDFAITDDDSFTAPDDAFDDDDAFASDSAVDTSESDETLIDEDSFDEPVFDDSEEVPVVDPLAPPVVDANGIPYETAVSEEEAMQAAARAEAGAQTVAANAGAAAANTGASAPAHSALSVTVTSAAPAAPSATAVGVEVHPRRRTFADYAIPTEGVLESYPSDGYQIIDAATRAAGEELKATLGDFKIEAEVTGIRKGPVVTMFEILPAPGVKLSKIVALQDNIALRLAASSVRIVAPIPGKHAVGIEVPNRERAVVGFKEIIDQDLPQFKKMAIPVVLGKDISGEAQLIDLAKTPHLLIAGSTGAGKSVCVNTMILSILYKRSPDQVKLIMIDPKVVELKLYNDIPHLLTPVITESKRAFQSLQFCLCEMERRYALLDGMGVRDIVSYNKRIVERHIATEKLPYIVVIIDEFADLMATTGKELEQTIARLAAMSRAVGIHLVLATQRPSVDVITGLIKANIPSRIAFMVASKMDSRIIIDQVGAEKLLGKGDMLYASATNPFPVRIQGTLVNDNEVERVVDCVKEYGEPDYIDDEIFVDDDDDGAGNPGLFGEGEDPLYDEALEIVMQAGKASASYIQRRLKIGYNRAARLVEEMEERGIVGPANGSKPREIIHVV